MPKQATALSLYNLQKGNSLKNLTLFLCLTSKLNTRRMHLFLVSLLMQHTSLQFYSLN